MKLSTILSSICSATTVLAAYDQNRGGAVLKAPSGDSFASVSGTFVVPNLSGTSRLSIWLGIADSLTQSYILGGGILYNTTLTSWSAFFPSASLSSTIPVFFGDSITVSTSISGATGTVTITNDSKNITSTQTLSAPASVDPTALTALTADWWVQAYQVIPGELVTTPNYGSISFTNCKATTIGGADVPLSGAGIFSIQGTSGQIYSKTSVSGAGVTVQQCTNPSSC